MNTMQELQRKIHHLEIENSNLKHYERLYLDNLTEKTARLERCVSDARADSARIIGINLTPPDTGCKFVTIGEGVSWKPCIAVIIIMSGLFLMSVAARSEKHLAETAEQAEQESYVANQGELE